MKERLHKDLKSLGILLIVGTAYLIFFRVFGFGIPCPVKLITGFDCPSCGITRMIVSISRLDFVKAFNFNPVLFITLPMIVACFLANRIRYIKTGERESYLICRIALGFEIGLLLVYGVVRNIG